MSFGYDGKEVLSHVNINIHKGDYLGVIGPNGSGKTTLLKIMLGLLEPTKGVVRFNGRLTIGYVGQKVIDFDRNFPVTVEEVAAMGRVASRGLLRRLNQEDHEAVKSALQQVEMWNLRGKMIGDLSGGQQQRVFIARALAAQPEVIFLDEPTLGIDAKAQEAFYVLLRRLNKQFKVTLVLVSHDVQVVAHEVTEIACVNRTLIYERDPQHFIQHGGLKKLYGTEVTFLTHQHV